MLVSALPVSAGWRDSAAPLETEFGAEIVFDRIAIQASIAGSKSIMITAAPEASREAYLVALRPALAAYDKLFLKRNLSQIAIFESMTVDGVEFGGTFVAERRIVYLQGRLIGRKQSGFHHEFSSILIRSFDLLFPQVAWRGAIPPSFHSLVEDTAFGNAALAQNSDTQGGPGTYEKGFIAGYGMTRLEEDINTYHQAMLAEPERLSFLAGVYPGIDRKAALLAGFLKSIGCGCVPGFWQ